MSKYNFRTGDSKEHCAISSAKHFKSSDDMKSKCKSSASSSELQLYEILYFKDFSVLSLSAATAVAQHCQVYVTGDCQRGWKNSWNDGLWTSCGSDLYFWFNSLFPCATHHYHLFYLLPHPAPQFPCLKQPCSLLHFQIRTISSSDQTGKHESPGTSSGL